MLGWLKSAITFGAKLVSFLWSDGSPRPTLTDGLAFAVANLMPAVEKAINYGGMSTQAKFDSWLETIDQTTGTDPGAVDVFRNIPAEQEEQLFDHFKEAARIYGYNLLRVPGYYAE